MRSPDSHRKSSYGLSYLGLGNHKRALWNLMPPELYENAIKNGEGILTDHMVLRVLTGKYTGRSPNDKFIVDEPSVRDEIDWGPVNQPIPEKKFDLLLEKVKGYLNKKEVYVKDLYAGNDHRHRLNVRIVSEMAYHALFADNMFIHPAYEDLKTFQPDFTVLAAPYFTATPENDDTNSGTFIVIHFAQKMVLIGGTLYAGEIKKSIFTVMNYLLPRQEVLSMHCAANMSENGSTALFFGLSGTGKTTLSSDPDRILIGDDEHGWGEDGVFNIEGGCYAKTIHLSKKQEPLIFSATKKAGGILENVVLHDTREPDFHDASITQNTRCSYPIDFIANATATGRGNHPDHIIFLTCDAFGVFPPVAKLTLRQAKYYFMSGYTAKVAGTERGISEPQATFSPCFGAPFMPLHPQRYAELLDKKSRKFGSSIWLLNTGWTSGAYGEGDRIRLGYTRQILNEILSGNLEDATFAKDPVFKLSIPHAVNGIPDNILQPRNTWENKQTFDTQAKKLAAMFNENFKNFEQEADSRLMEAGPKI